MAPKTRSLRAELSGRPSRRGRLTKRQLGFGLLLIALILPVVGVWQSHRRQNLDEVKIISAKVSRHYQLPTNETPALATVTDSAKVQSLLVGKVKNNDKILIYENHQKAIVYRPSIDRIVDVETITVSKPTSSTSNSSSTAIPNINPFGTGN